MNDMLCLAQAGTSPCRSSILDFMKTCERDPIPKVSGLMLDLNRAKQHGRNLYEASGVPWPLIASASARMTDIQSCSPGRDLKDSGQRR
jgi:hypothetical protein